ncbi:hypothetical protein [Streptomyces sp. 6N223]|uniref:hypothetical protein n=1 Tax=Streptomyces sp. 6N223 TaxID=3457412 RepID=UPI003FD1DF93
MIRDGYDQTLTIDPRNPQFLYQGLDPAATTFPACVRSGNRPWRFPLLRGPIRFLSP